MLYAEESELAPKLSSNGFNFDCTMQKFEKNRLHQCQTRAPCCWQWWWHCICHHQHFPTLYLWSKIIYFNDFYIARSILSLNVADYICASSQQNVNGGSSSSHTVMSNPTDELGLELHFEVWQGDQAVWEPALNCQCTGAEITYTKISQTVFQMASQPAIWVYCELHYCKRGWLSEIWMVRPPCEFATLIGPWMAKTNCILDKIWTSNHVPHH